VKGGGGGLSNLAPKDSFGKRVRAHKGKRNAIGAKRGEPQRYLRKSLHLEKGGTRRSLLEREGSPKAITAWSPKGKGKPPLKEGADV